MSGNLLSRAAGALRETAAAGSGDETLARVLRDVRRGQRRRRLAGVTLLPLALVLTTMGAWAATTGRLAAVARKVWPAPAALRTAAAPRPPAPVRAAPEIIPIAPEAPPPAAAVPEARPAATRPSIPRHARAPESVASSAPLTEADELYRQAHEAHFGRGDFAAALVLWDRYLAVSPLPRLTPEARYNRAIALLRLGRRDEAARALRPFAEGDYGAYRATEARALLRNVSSP
jgi:hypothetical protein